jgi:hypothetical protein
MIIDRKHASNNLINDQTFRNKLPDINKRNSHLGRDNSNHEPDFAVKETARKIEEHAKFN